MKSNHTGFTFLEMMLAVGLLSVVSLAMVQLSLTASHISRESAALAALEGETLKVIEEISRELINGTDNPSSGFVMDEGGFTVAPVTGYDYDTGEPLYGNAITWVCVWNDGELDDGTDNNGNQLVDEMKLLRIDSEENIRVVCNNVARHGLQFNKQGKKVVISLTLTALIPASNQVIERTISPVTVTLRN